MRVMVSFTVMIRDHDLENDDGDELVRIWIRVRLRLRLMLTLRGSGQGQDKG